MIYSFLSGRLGNCLFEIAAGASLAKKRGVPFRAVVDKEYLLAEPDNCLLSEYLEPFQTNIFRKIVMQEHYPAEAAVYQETAFQYAPLPEENNLVLKGYFQSERYFDKEVVRRLFEIDDVTKEYIERKYGAVLRDRETVSVSVRRGDYLKLTPLYIICKQYYYHRAMAYLGKEKTFVIISDDIAWCRKKLKGENLVFIDDEPPLVDLYLATLCKHNIISNSTFSWWGAWLNPNPEKIVIYPSMWFGPLNYRIKDASDLCPLEWISIAVHNPWMDFIKKSRLAVFYYRHRYMKDRTRLKKSMPSFLLKSNTEIIELRLHFYALVYERTK